VNWIEWIIDDIGRELEAIKKDREDRKRFIVESNEWYQRIKPRALDTKTNTIPS
jgi:hypothetical protein